MKRIGRAGGGVAAIVAALSLGAAAFPAGSEAITLEPIGSFQRPTSVTSDPQDPNLLLVSELDGKVEMVNRGSTSTVLDLAEAGLLMSEQASGLFSLAPSPDFHSTGHLYAFYSRAPTASDPSLAYDLAIDRFTLAGDTIALGSRRPVLTIPNDHDLDHVGGQLQFGPDGMLYAAVGDGSEGDDALEAAQSLDELHGKLLRIDPAAPGPGPFSIPADNPFAGPTPGRDEIFSYGLRNPWRFSFDRSTGDLWIADVGESLWEEVDYGSYPDLGRGANYGWDCREGPDVFEPDGCAGPFTDPVFAYPSGSEHASITGGYVARDPSLGDVYGRYVYGDSVRNQIRTVDPWAPGGPDDRFELSFDTPISFGEDACGHLYVTSLHGAVDRLIADGQSTAAGCTPPSSPAAPPLDPVAPVRCGSRAATVGGTTGTTGDDVIIGGPAEDRINARGGDDLVCAGGGDDRIRGFGGDDVLRGAEGADRLDGGGGDDRCLGGGGRDRKRNC